METQEDIQNEMGEILVNDVYLGDCSELMKKIPDNSVDLIFTSPPYNTGIPLRWSGDCVGVLQKIRKKIYRF